jgi:CspA family cold shock protein
MKGTVKWYNIGKGYGFIRGNNKKDIFVHVTGLLTGIYPDENDQVEYDIVKTQRGQKAVKVKLL